MAHPVALARYASMVVEGKTYNDVGKLWQACVPDPALVRDLHAAKVKGQIDLKLVQRLADVHASMRKRGPNRGKREQQPKAAAVTRARKDLSRAGCPNLH